jgi:hypothetical protein
MKEWIVHAQLNLQHRQCPVMNMSGRTNNQQEYPCNPFVDQDRPLAFIRKKRLERD